MQVKINTAEIPVSNRQSYIFDVFDLLRINESILLTADYEPKPLYFQLLFDRRGLFEWDTIEKGPPSWRVRISRIAK